jgi:hypothetical protein
VNNRKIIEIRDNKKSLKIPKGGNQKP